MTLRDLTSRPGVALYALLGAALAFMRRGRRRKGTAGRVAKAAALGAGVALVAPSLGVALPGTTRTPRRV